MVVDIVDVTANSSMSYTIVSVCLLCVWLAIQLPSVGNNIYMALIYSCIQKVLKQEIWWYILQHGSVKNPYFGIDKMSIKRANVWIFSQD